MRFTVWTLWSETKLRVYLPSYLSYVTCFKTANLLEKVSVTEIQLNLAASLVFHVSQAEQERHYKKITGLG